MNKDYRQYGVDFKEVHCYFDIHKALYDGLELPEYYGANLDALWDCLTDKNLNDLHIDLKNYDDMEKLDREYAGKLLSVFQDFKHCYDDEYIHTIIIRVFRGEEMEEIK